MSIALIIILSILGFILMIALSELMWISRLESNVEASRNSVAELKYINYICGTVGAGKTTMACGITNMLQDALIERAKRTIKGFATIYYDLDLRPANAIINDLWGKGVINAYKIAIKILTQDPYKQFNNTYYSNYMTEKVPFSILLRDYIEAQMSLLRFNYVYYYNGAFYSFITDKMAMPFSPEMIDIKDRAESKDYKILKYSIIFEDEKQLSGKLSTSWQSYAKADGGASDFLRLIRQLGKGTIFYITTSQEFGADEVRERNLATSIIYVLKMKRINPYFIERFFLALAYQVVMYLFTFKGDYFARDELERFYYPSNRLKKALFAIKQANKRLESKSYLKYSCLKYNSATDVGKRQGIATYGTEQLCLTFPIRYCFGSINTYQFGAVQDYLIGNTTYTGKDTKKGIATDEELASRILAKKQKEQKKSKSD